MHIFQVSETAVKKIPVQQGSPLVYNVQWPGCCTLRPIL